MFNKVLPFLAALFILIAINSLQAHEYAFFSPPKEWLIAKQTSSPSVKVCFLQKEKRGFSPSINLATEPTTVSLNEYAAAVRQIHEEDGKSRWRKLGTVQTKAGEALLTQIDCTSDQNESMRLLQLLLIHNGKAYILTAGALKEQAAELYPQFLSSFRSFTITSDLLSPLPDEASRQKLLLQIEKLKDSLSLPSFEKKILPAFQKKFSQEHADLGGYWQLLVLQEMIKSPPPSPPAKAS